MLDSLESLIGSMQQKAGCCSSDKEQFITNIESASTPQPRSKRRRTVQCEMSNTYDTSNRSESGCLLSTCDSKGDHLASTIEKKQHSPNIPTKESILALLAQKGLLRRLYDKRFALAIPGCGLFIENLLKGRKAILNFVRKR